MINTSEILAADMQVLCASILNAVQRFYENPENQQQFETWMKEREKNGGE